MGATFVRPAIAALSAGTAIATAATVVMSNSNGVSFGVSGNTITASVQAGAAAGMAAIAAGTQTATSGTVVFSDSNGISFGLSGSSRITASYTVPTVTNSSATISAGTTSGTLSNLVFSNSNGLSFGLNAGTITGSYTVPSTAGLISAVNVSGGTTSNNLSAVTFSNSNNVSFGLNGSTLTASASYSQSTAPAALAAGTQTATSGTLVLSDSNGISFGLSGSTRITASYTVPSTAGLISAVNLSAGTTSNNASAFTFSDSNGISFGLNASTITASHNGLMAAIQSISAGTTRATIGQVIFSNSNGVSFGMDNGTITATVNPGAAAGIAAIQGGTQTATSGTVVFSDSNGISFGLSGSTRMTASYTVPTVPSQLSVGVSTGGNTAGDTGLFTGRMVLAGTGNVTLSGSSNAGSVTYSISVATQTVQTQSNVQGISAGTQVGRTGDIVFSDSNGISFGMSGSTRVTASYTVPTVPAQFSGGFSTNGNTAGDTGLVTGRLVMIGGNNVTLSGSTNAGSISVTISAFNQSAQTQSNIQAVYDGANSISTGTIRFTNANGVSFSVNGQTVSASIAPRKVSHLPNCDNPWGQTNFTISNASFSLQHWNPRADITATQANLLMALSGNSGSSGALTVSMGIYTMNGSTLSLASSDSRQISWTSGSQTTASTRYGGVSGTMYRTVPLASWAISAGDYMLGMWFRTTNDGTWRAFGQQGPTIVNGIDANETNAYVNGFSTSSFTTAMVATLNVTDTNFVRTGGDALKHPNVVFLGTY